MAELNPQVAAAVSFLVDHFRILQNKKEKIDNLENKLENYRPAVEEYRKTKDAIDALKAERRSSEKFLMSMKQMIEQNYGITIQTGDETLFDQKPEEVNADKQ